MTNQTASFWKYTGNHPMGQNHERRDPHDFGLDLIAAMAFWGNSGDYQAPLTYEDIKLIKVRNQKDDDFGHEVTVSAPVEVWEKGRQVLESLK